MVCLCVLFSLLPSEGWAVGEDAAAAFEEGRLKDASVAYEALLREHGPQADAYYNLGVTYVAMGAWPEAMLNLERAKVMAGGRDVDAHLSFVREQLSTSSPGRDEAHFRELEAMSTFRWFHGISGNGVAWAVLVVWWLSLGGWLLRKRVTHPALRDALMVMVVGGMVIVLVGGGYVVGQWQTDGLRPAIVMMDTNQLYDGPSEGAPTHEQEGLHAGVMVEVLEVRGRWWRVALVDGERGWLPEEALADVRTTRWRVE